MTVYAFKAGKLEEQLGEDQIVNNRYKSEGQVRLATGRLASVFQERSTTTNGVLNFVVCTQDVLDAAVARLDKIKKGEITSSRHDNFAERAESLHEVFSQEAAVLKRARKKGAPKQTTSLEESIVSIIAKNFD